MPLQSLIRNALSGLEAFCAPRHCEICGKSLEDVQSKFDFICYSCWDALPPAPLGEVSFNWLLEHTRLEDIAISRIYSLFSAKEDFKYMKLVYALKYYGFTHIGRQLGEALGRQVVLQSDCKYECIIPVPIHRARQRERGFNQSEKIAEGISNVLNIPVNNKTVRRLRYTTTQTILAKHERKTNLIGAFAPYSKSRVDNQSYARKNVLLVDDVLTTGSTLNNCAAALVEMGFARVDVATLARA
jgi:ComF family protein